VQNNFWQIKDDPLCIMAGVTEISKSFLLLLSKHARSGGNLVRTYLVTLRTEDNGIL
jgi:hypothetical protein